MNAMGHNVPTMIGVRQDDLAAKINDLVPGYMAMGERGMDEMSTMRMPLPANTLPMMMGEGPFGGIDLGVVRQLHELPGAGHAIRPGHAPRDRDRPPARVQGEQVAGAGLEAQQRRELRQKLYGD